MCASDGVQPVLLATSCEGAGEATAMDVHSLEVLFKRQLESVREVTRAGVTQFVWNQERYGDKDDLHEGIRKYLLQRYPTDAEQKIAAFGPTKLPSGRTSAVQPSPPTVPIPLKANGFDFLFGIAGALVAGALVVGLEILIIVGISALFGGRVTGRGLGWIVMPIMAMVAGYRLGPMFASDITSWTGNAVRAMEVRTLLAASAFWIVAVVLFVLLFEPFGYYMRERDYWTVGKVIAFPVMLGIIGLGLIGWLRRQSERSR